jgi:Mg/Co/Ni transporter MgtE
MNDKNKTQQIYSVRYTLRRDQIVDFVNQLHDMQQEYNEQAVEASKYKQAIEVINHIKSL